MNTDRLRTDLQVLANRVGPPDPDLAVRVLDRRHRQDRSRWVAAGVVVGVGAAVVATPALLHAADRPAATASRGADGVGGLYDAPTRGSLAADDDVVARALAASWDDGDVGGMAPDPAEEDRRVAFAGDVPGGQVWTLVVARDGTGLAAAWFVDIDPADGIDLQLAATPVRTALDAPVALIDAGADPTPLVVVAAPGTELAMSAPGSSSFTELDTIDGVAVTQVRGPVDPASLPRYAVVDDDVVTGRWAPAWFDSRLPLSPQSRVEPGVVFPADAVHGARIALCLQEADWPVTMLADGSLAYVGQLTPTMDEALQTDLARCEVESGYR